MTYLRRAATLVRASAFDALALGGLALLAYGLGLYSPPLAPIVLGLGLLAAVRFGTR